MGKMVYDWESKEELCYRMYIEEKKSLDEIIEYLKEEHQFTPRYFPINIQPFEHSSYLVPFF